MQDHAVLAAAAAGDVGGGGGSPSGVIVLSCLYMGKRVDAGSCGTGSSRRCWRVGRQPLGRVCLKLLIYG